jgi:hypothetical protein
VYQDYSIFNKCAGNKRKSICKRKRLDHSLTPYTKIISEWSKGLSARPETLKVLEDIGEKFHEIEFSNDTKKHRQQKKKYINWTSLK